MGFSWSQFTQLAERLAPIVLSLIPSVPPQVIPLVTKGIVDAESLYTEGFDKKQSVLALLHDGLVTLNATKGEIVLDPSVVGPAVDKGIDAVITTINAVKAAHTEDVTEQVSPAKGKV
jgi:hypothetical protein